MTIASEVEAKAYVRELCSHTAFGRLEAFVAQLKRANEKQNLISKPTLELIWQRHIADSAQVLRYVSRETSPLLDLGTGAGFPGLILAIMRPDLDIILVESRALRISWLAEIIGLTHATNCRIEGVDLSKVPSFAAGTITARAFAPLAKLLELSVRFSTSETGWVLPKGRSARQEVAELPVWLREKFHVEQSVTDPDAGIIVGKGRMERPK